MKFYHVVAKCGHVGGKDKYIDIDFYAVAGSASEAAQFVRLAPRVKHHHPDAIRSVRQITYEDYILGKQQYEEDPFTQCRNAQEQKAFGDLIRDRICTERELEREEKIYNPKRAYRYGYVKGKRINIRSPYRWCRDEAECAV